MNKEEADEKERRKEVREKKEGDDQEVDGKEEKMEGDG